MSTNEMVRRVNSGEVVILDEEISSHCYYYYHDRKKTKEMEDWIFQYDEPAGVFWAFKALEGLR